MRRGLVAAILAAGVMTTAHGAASADTGWTLTEDTGYPNDFWFANPYIETGPFDPPGCHIIGVSVKPFSTSTTFATGPHAGRTMTFSGTMTVGPQTSFGDPSYGFNAYYGALTDLTGTFSINTTPAITGTFDGLATPFGAAWNTASCYGVGSGSGNFGYGYIFSGALIALHANVNYTAVQNGETITGTVSLQQRQTNVTQGSSYTGPDVSFYGPTMSTDVTPPTITATDDLHFAQGSNATPNFSCADETGGSGLATCVGSVTALDTATAGSKTYTVNATDNAGNPATRTVTYIVDAPPPPALHYTVAGFQQPIDMGGVVNSAKAGQAIPAKWQLRDANGALVSDPASFVNATSSAISCVNGAPTDVIEEYTTGASGLQYNAGTWQFNWATPKSYAGTCRVFSVNLADGTHIVAKFQFK